MATWAVHADRASAPEDGSPLRGFALAVVGSTAIWAGVGAAVWWLVG